MCNYILFTNLPWTEDSEVKLTPVYPTRWRLNIVPFFAERPAGKL